MREYIPLFESLKLPELVCTIADQRFPISDYAGYVDPYFIHRGFPPAFLPLWSATDHCVGVWYHWFTMRYSPYVKMVYQAFSRSLSIIEMARDLQQVALVLAQTPVVLSELDSSQVNRMLTAFDLTLDDFQCLHDLTAKHGDMLTGLLQHPRFRDNAPLACFSQSSYPGLYTSYCPEEYEAKHYTGVFLTDWNAGQLDLGALCPYDLGCNYSDETLNLLDQWPSLQRWGPPNKSYLDTLLTLHDVKSAWLYLNSPCWSPREVYPYLRQIASIVVDPRFSMLVNAWAGCHQL